MNNLFNFGAPQQQGTQDPLNFGGGLNFGNPVAAGNAIPDNNTVGNFTPQLSGFGQLNQGIQAGGALLQGYLGFKQLGLARDSLNFQRDAFNKNYQNQVQTTNRQLEDRQRLRAAANPGAQSVEEYLANNRVS